LEPAQGDYLAARTAQLEPVLRGGALNAIVAVIILASFIVGIICSAVAGFLAGYFALAHQRPQALLAAWDGIIIVFCLFWVVGLLAEIQRSESVDMAKLLHLPLSLQQVFIFNYVASHVTAAILLMVPGMVSLSLGLALGAGVRMALLIPLALGSFRDYVVDVLFARLAGRSDGEQKAAARHCRLDHTWVRPVLPVARTAD
jgi:hypothetical protein